MSNLMVREYWVIAKGVEKALANKYGYVQVEESVFFSRCKENYIIFAAIENLEQYKELEEPLDLTDPAGVASV